MLNSFISDKDLFEEKVYLYISDNCSEEPLSKIVEEFERKGLNVHYHRNETNIGGDNNIISCYQKGCGKYVLVLGSDDIPKPGVIRNVVQVLELDDFGLVHLNHHHVLKKGSKIYNNPNDFLVDINVWITFTSSNIVCRDFIKDWDVEKYRYTNLSQVMLYIQAAVKSENNVIISEDFFEEENDSSNNGGYNLFKVFVVNLLSILSEAVDKSYISSNTYKAIKKSNFKNLLAGEVNRRLLFNNKKRMDTSKGWTVVMKYYGKNIYTYYYMLLELFKSLKRKL
jgi:hypothetical protein